MNDQDRTATIRTDFPYRIEKNSRITIPMSDGVRLAGTAWIPRQDEHCRERFVTIFEYSPYRKADWTSNRDETRLKYFSSFGFVCLRVDIRGTGNSQGFFDDEYSPQELSDGLQILDWIQSQPWSNGKVRYQQIVMFGKSWAGFNGLQLATFNHPNLTGVISAYSTDDRYSDDIHYIGGSLPVEEALSWSTQMLLWLAIPPHPSDQGGLSPDEDRDRVWNDRLNHIVPLDKFWMKHQTRDSYWRHGSVCENYSSIRCPVLLIGGFADLYSDAVFRLIDQLNCPKRAILGPWGHQWPDQALPGPQIGFLQEVVQWLEFYQKNIDNGYHRKRTWTVYQLFPNKDELDSIVLYRRGQWIQTNQIVSTPDEHNERNEIQRLSSNSMESKQPTMKFIIGPWTLRRVNETIDPSQSVDSIEIEPSNQMFLSSGRLLSWGNAYNHDNPTNQYEDDRHCLVFQSSIIEEDLDLFGFPLVRLKISSSEPVALLVLRLCLIDPEDESSSILVSRSCLNLSHMKSHEKPVQLDPNKIYNLEMKLSAVCLKIRRGSTIRLCLSNSLCPIVWPSSRETRLKIHFDDPMDCSLTIPLLDSDHQCGNEFLEPEWSQPLNIETKRAPSSRRNDHIDEVKGRVEIEVFDDDGLVIFPDGGQFEENSIKRIAFEKDTPGRVRVEIERALRYDAVEVKLKSSIEEKDNRFVVEHRLETKKEEEKRFDKLWHLEFDRIVS